jgi:hypothetical protein
MEFDQHSNSEAHGDHKETKKKQAKKRVPAHVPLPVEEQKKASLEKKKKQEIKKHGLPKEKPRAEQADRVLKPVPENIEELPESIHHEPEPTEKSDHDPVMSIPFHEREVPLHETTEGEVFVSERLRHDGESSDTEAELGVEDADAATLPKSPNETVGKEAEDVKPRLRQNPQQQQQTRIVPANGSPAAPSSSPFLAQWRNRNMGAPQNPNTPPPSPNQPSAPPGLPPQNPNVQPFNPNLPPSPNALPITSQQVPERIRDRASERKHLVTGLIVGALVEHIRHKRREKRMTKAHNKEVKGIKKDQEGERIERRAEQNKQLREKTALEKTIERLEKTAVPFAAVAANKNPEKNVSQKSSSTEKLQTAPVKTMEEAKKEFEERARKAVESAREPEEELEVPTDHRIERSAWHAVEVDKKTGKAVEDASFGYGEAFHQEQQQEQFKKSSSSLSAAESDASSASLSGGALHQANPLMLPNAPQYPELSSGQTKAEKARERGTELAQDAAQVLGKIQPIDGLLWIILGIIVLVIFKLL